MESTGIIKEIYTKKRPVTTGDAHIAHIEGLLVPGKKVSVRYQNTATNETYLALSGALAWPGKRPGYIVVAAAKEIKGKEDPIFIGLEEIEDNSVRGLLVKVHELNFKYASGCANIPFLWFGDPESGHNTMISKLLWFMQDGTVNFALTYPPHWKEKANFLTYCQIVMGLAKKDIDRIWLTKCPKLKSYLLNVHKDGVEKSAQVSDYPAIAAFGYVLSYLYEQEPWLMFEDDWQLHETMEEDYAAMAMREEARTMRILEGEDYHEGEIEEMRKFDLVPTMG